MQRVEAAIPSSRGRLAATIHYPEKESGRLAILCPGYLDSKDYWHLVGLADALCSQGYVAVRFDPTGTWGSEGSIAEYTTTQYLEDIRGVLEYMLQRGDYPHVLLGGHSRGGMVSILLAARDPRISLVLGIMPSSGRSMTERGREEWKATGVRVSHRDVSNTRNERREFLVPYTHMEDRDRYNVAMDVRDVKVPIVLIAGEHDELVRPEDVRKIFDNANEPKSLTVVAGIGHDYRRRADDVTKVNEMVLEQLQKLS
ncbi:MAG: alpha/beta hydrolase [bacterium]|nr:alpha/beta hydrolase [bacterium]